MDELGQPGLSVTVFNRDSPSNISSLKLSQSNPWESLQRQISSRFDIAKGSNIVVFIESSEMEGISNDNNEEQWLECDQNTLSQVNHNNIKLSFAVIGKNKNDNDSDSESSDGSSNDHNDNNSDNIEDLRKNDLVIDIFGRFPEILKKLGLKGSHNKTVQEYRHGNEIKQWLNKHNENNVQSGDFIVTKHDIYELWLLLQTKQLTIYNENDKYTIIKDNETNVQIRTRRVIWPLNFQYYGYGSDNSWKYYFEDMRKLWVWGIFIISGGRFAGAVYHGNEMILHKTFHRYITHKKRNGNGKGKSGKSGKQNRSSHQSKNKLSHFHDSGEKGFENDIETLINLPQWKDYLSNKCMKIFVHACGAYNRNILFGKSSDAGNGGNGNNNVNGVYRLSSKDKRVHNIPISVGVPTLMEVERVHYWLSTCWMDLPAN